MNIYHGKIICLDKNNTVCSYLVEEKGRIAWVGDSLPPEYLIPGKSEITELGSRVLLPSFGDGHMHFSNWALIAGSYFDVREAENIPGIQKIIRKYVSENKKKKIVIAFGVSRHSVEEKRLICRSELDEACPDIPLVIVCYDGHSSVFNSRMLEKYPDSIKNLRGYDEENGHLFYEAYLAGTDFAASLVPPLELVKSITRSFDLLAEKGIGMIHTVEGIGFPKDLDVSLVNFIACSAARKNNFQTRLFFQTMDTDKVIRRRLPRIGGCFATALDGCFGACDAALLKPYSNNSQNSGILFHREDEVTEFAKKANRLGLQIELHAIGDAAVSRAVEAIEAALEDYPQEDHRHTIIHASLVADNDIEKIARLGIGITLQPSLMICPLEPASYLEEILGSRYRKSTPLRALLDAGIHVSGGSDAPVTHPDPIEGIYAACNHPFDPSQSVTVTEALKMFTSEVAWTTFDDKDRGSLEPGKIADMVILDRDPLSVPPESLKTLKVEKLYLSGKEYKPGMGIAGMLWNRLTSGLKSFS